MTSKANQYTTTVVDVLLAQINEGENFSNRIDTYGTAITCIETPSNFVGDITFYVSSNGVDFRPYHNIKGELVEISPAAPNTAYGIAAQDFFPVRYIQIRTTVVQTSACQLRLIPKAI